MLRRFLFGAVNVVEFKRMSSLRRRSVLMLILLATSVAKAEPESFVCEWTGRVSGQLRHLSISFQFYPEDIGRAGHHSVLTDGYILGMDGFRIRPLNLHIKMDNALMMFTTAAQDAATARLFHKDAVVLGGGFLNMIVNYRLPGMSKRVDGKLAALNAKGRTLAEFHTSCYRLNQEDFSSRERLRKK